RRHAEGLAGGFQVLEHVRAAVGIIGKPLDADVLEEGERLLRVAGVDIDRDHVEVRAAEPALQRVERRYFLAARHAPGRPQVKKHGAAAPLLQAAVVAERVLEGQIGDQKAGMGHAQGRDLAMDQRGEPRRGRHRGRTGRIGRIASQTANPVYPRQHGESPGERPGRGGDQTAAAYLIIGLDRQLGHWAKNLKERGTRVMTNKRWGGRFGDKPAPIMEEINASIDFDRHLYRQDIAASKAHAAMLAKKGIITAQDAKRIAHGLDTILSEIEAGKFAFKRALEDIHMNVEGRLSELIGDAAGRLHTARSRNDQVATDFRLWVRDTIDALDVSLAAFQRALAEKALAHAGTVMPGLTHMQTAQPVTFGHHLLAYVEMTARDRGRFADARRRLNESPLGSAALAGSSFPLDRDMTAKALGFDRPMAN